MFAHLKPHCFGFGYICAFSESSYSRDDSSDSDDAPTEVVWAKVARGVWGMAHVLAGKLYFTLDHLQGIFIHKNLKLRER